MQGDGDVDVANLDRAEGEGSDVFFDDHHVAVDEGRGGFAGVGGASGVAFDDDDAPGGGQDQGRGEETEGALAGADVDEDAAFFRRQTCDLVEQGSNLAGLLQVFFAQLRRRVADEQAMQAGADIIDGEAAAGPRGRELHVRRWWR